MDLQHAYCYFLEDDEFRETDRPGLPAPRRHRRAPPDVLLAHRRWRHRQLPAPPHRQRAARHGDARQARLPHRRRRRRATSASCSARARRTSLPGRSGTATRSSSATTSSASAGSSTCSRRRGPTSRRRGERHDRTRLAARRRHRRHLHRPRAARRVHRHGGGRQDAHHTQRAARGRARAASAQLLGKAGRASERHHGADRARDDAHHERADRGQDRPRRPRHHRRLRRHAADPRRAPLRHVRPADRVPGAADPA